MLTIQFGSRQGDLEVKPKVTRQGARLMQFGRRSEDKPTSQMSCEWPVCIGKLHSHRTFFTTARRFQPATHTKTRRQAYTPKNLAYHQDTDTSASKTTFPTPGVDARRHDASSSATANAEGCRLAARQTPARHSIFHSRHQPALTSTPSPRRRVSSHQQAREVDL